MATIRFKNRYSWGDDPAESATAFVAAVASANDAGEIRTWKVKDGYLSHEISLNGAAKKFTGYVRVSNDVSDENLVGTLVATTVLSTGIETVVAEDPELRRRVHAMIASEFVELILYHFPELAPARAIP